MTDEKWNPDEDIDVAHDVDILRIERLGDCGMYVAGYTDSDDEMDFRYWLSCMDDGLHISQEVSRWDEDDNLIVGMVVEAASMNTRQCPDCRGDLDVISTESSHPIECQDCGSRFDRETTSYLVRSDDSK